MRRSKCSSLEHQKHELSKRWHRLSNDCWHGNRATKLRFPRLRCLISHWLYLLEQPATNHRGPTNHGFSGEHVPSSCKGTPMSQPMKYLVFEAPFCNIPIWYTVYTCIYCTNINHEENNNHLNEDFISRNLHILHLEITQHFTNWKLVCA